MANACSKDTKAEAFSGKKRIDAEDPYCITLVRKDVTGAVSRDPDNCAYAKGMERDPHVRYARFGATTVEVIFKDDPDTVVRFVLSRRGERLIYAFDAEPEKVALVANWAEGAEIQLLPPPPSKRMGVRKGGHSKAHTGTGRSTAKRAALRHL